MHQFSLFERSISLRALLCVCVCVLAAFVLVVFGNDAINFAFYIAFEILTLNTVILIKCFKVDSLLFRTKKGEEK